MTERREWHGQVDKQGCLRTHHDGGIRMDWESVHVREVLPGDEDLLDPRCDDVIELQKQHAALVEIATKVLRSSHIGDQNFIPCLDEAVGLRYALVDLQDALENEE